MKNGHIPESMARWAGVGLVLMAVLDSAVAFTGVGGSDGCPTFTTCTASVYSGAGAGKRYEFTDILGGYILPIGLESGFGQFQDIRSQDTPAPVRAAVGDFCVNCGTNNPFFSSAVARAQSDFGTNRASASTSVGVSGTDDRGAAGSAQVNVLTFAQVTSEWRDVWTFNADGHLNASIQLDGRSSTNTTNGFFPSSFSYSIRRTLGNWFYDLRVWDVTNLSVSEFFPLGGPTQVARVQNQALNANEQRPSFGSTLALDFDFMAGVQYVVTAEMGIQAEHGREIDLYNTARLGGAVLSAGAQLNALSGHDYLAPVPEPGPALMWLGGLAAIALWSRRRLRTAEDGAWAHPQGGSFCFETINSTGTTP